MKTVFVCLILFFNSIHLFSSNLIDIDRTQKKRLKNLVLFEIGTYSLGLYAMNELWYKDYPKSKFHFMIQKINFYLRGTMLDFL